MPIWYNCIVAWARLPRALPSMPSRRAVLLTPPKSSGPPQLLSCKPVAPVSPLDSALVNSLVSVGNKELTGNLSPLDSALTKNRGVGSVMVNQLPPVKIAVLSFHPLMNCPPFPREKQSLSFHALTNCPFSIPFVLTFMHRMGGVGGSQAGFLKYYFNFPAARTAPAFGRPDAPTFQRFNVQTCLRRFAAFPFPAIHSGDGNLAAA